MANPEYGGTIVQLANIYIATLINIHVGRSLPRQVDPDLLKVSRSTTFHAGT
jgi:hypothetical protein